MNKAPANEVLLEGLIGAAMGAVIAINPDIAGVFVVYKLLETFIEGLYKGYSMGEIITSLTLTGLAEIALPSTGDDLADIVVDASFGTAKELMCAGGELWLEGDERSTPDPAVITYTIISSIAAGGGGAGGIWMMETFDYSGGSKLWIE